ncbi:hypothetical protein WJX74_005273 [Apatococcus lobatus]|uniref:SAP domain-containing protein n=1 Tax=Apatococcus lobatus TaxID=904363 RepID=A0AAW1RQA3_9CHLO
MVFCLLPGSTRAQVVSQADARGRIPRVGLQAPTKSSLRKLSKAKLQQELLSKKASTSGKKDVLIARLLELTAQEETCMAKLLAELENSDKQHEALRTAFVAASAKCSSQRLQIQDLSEELAELREASHVQQAKAAATAQTAAQQKDDAVWVQRMTSEIQALSARITSLLRELVERDGVVAALRMQLRQRQLTLSAERSLEPALVAAGQLEAQEGQAASLNVAPQQIGPDARSTSSMQSQKLSSRAAELDAIWCSPSSSARAVTTLPRVIPLSRQTTGTAFSQASNSLRNLHSPGMLLAAAALQGDRLMASIMSQEDCSRFYAASAGILGAAVLAAAWIS